MTATAQPGITADLPPQAQYLYFQLHTPEACAAALTALNRLDIVDGERVVVGIGISLANSLCRPIAGLKLMPAMAGAGYSCPSTPYALWCWVRADSRGEAVLASRQLADTLADAFTLDLVVDAYAHQGRDLSGYEDGTENPKGDAIDPVAFVSEGSLAGSSFVAVQQWEHDLDVFAQFSGTERDRIIGRRLSDNEELDNAPAYAHTQRTAQENFEPEAFVWRRSMPWSNGLSLGLQFVAFAASFQPFEQQMQRMLGVEDNITDGLFRFSTPLNGAYFWCPPRRADRAGLDFSALGLK